MTLREQGHDVRRRVVTVKRIGEVLIQGWLSKRGPTDKYGFKKYWCILRSKSLSYYADESKLEKKGELELNASMRALSFIDPQAPRHAAELIPEHPSGFVLDIGPDRGQRHRFHYFDAANDATLDSWITALSKAVSAAASNGSSAGGSFERRGSAFHDVEAVASTPELRRRGSCFDEDAGDSVPTPVEKATERKGNWVDDTEMNSSVASTTKRSKAKVGRANSGSFLEFEEEPFSNALSIFDSGTSVGEILSEPREEFGDMSPTGSENKSETASTSRSTADLAGSAPSGSSSSTNEKEQVIKKTRHVRKPKSSGPIIGPKVTMLEDFDAEDVTESKSTVKAAWEEGDGTPSASSNVRESDSSVSPAAKVEPDSSVTPLAKHQKDKRVTRFAIAESSTVELLAAVSHTSIAGESPPVAGDESDRLVGDKSRGVSVKAVMPVGEHFIYLSKGSIIDYKGDVIVNAANEAGQIGGGLDCSLMKAAGPDVDNERLAFPEVRPGIRIPVGKVRVTSAGKLHAKCIVHAVGPNYKGASAHRFEVLDQRLRDAYTGSLEAAFERECQSIGFALLSSGAFCSDRGLENVLEIALNAVRCVLEGRPPGCDRIEVDFVAYDTKELHALYAVARGLGFEGAPDPPGPDSRASFSSCTSMGRDLFHRGSTMGRTSTLSTSAWPNRSSISPSPRHDRASIAHR